MQNFKFDHSYVNIFVNKSISIPIEEEQEEENHNKIISNGQSEENDIVQTTDKEIRHSEANFQDDSIKFYRYTTPQHQNYNPSCFTTPPVNKLCSTPLKKKLQLNKSTIQRTDSSLVESDKQTQWSGVSSVVRDLNFSQSKSNSFISHPEAAFQPYNQPQFQLGMHQISPDASQANYQTQCYLNHPDESTYCNLYTQQQRQDIYPIRQISQYSQVPTTYMLYQEHQQTQQTLRKGRRQYENFEILVENIFEDRRTTLMIKNIPCKYSQSMLLQEIDKISEKQYDFFYLPIDFTNKCNVGYAFINFTDLQYIERFFCFYNSKIWNISNSKKVCQITYAKIQGRNELNQHFQNSTIMNQKDRKMKPVFFRKELNLDSIKEIVQRQKQQEEGPFEK